MEIKKENIPTVVERTSLRWLRNLIILLIAGFLLFKILPPLKGIIIMFVLAMLIAYLLDPIVSIMENNGYPRLESIIFLFVLIGFLLFLSGIFLFEPIKTEIGGLIKFLQKSNMESIEQNLRKFITANFPLFQDQVDDIINAFLTTFSDEALNIAQKTLSFIQGIFSLITQILIIPLIAFFLLKDGPSLKKEIFKLIPNKFFEMSLHMHQKADQQIGRYIRGQLIDSFLLAVLYAIGFNYLGIKFFIILSIFSGVANIIPYVGPVIAAIPPIIVSVLTAQSFDFVPQIILLFVVIQIIDVVIFQPTVVAKSVQLHPLIIIFSVLAGGQLLGIVGMLFAVLLAGIIKVVIVETAWSYRNYHLEKRYTRYS